MSELTGKIAVITGGTSGMGLAAADQFIKDGACVVIAGRSANGEGIAAGIGPADHVRFFRTDVAVEEDVKNLLDFTLNTFGRVDIAVAAAGVSGFTLDVYDSKVWQDTINTNLNGVFYLCKYSVEAMKKTGGGSIVLVGSCTSLVGNYGTVCYPAAKSGVAGIARSAGITNIKDGIRVNCIVPGFVDTPMMKGVPADDLARNLAMVPIGRMADPAEIAKAISFLASDDASYVVGSVMVVDGGYTAQ